MRFLRKVSVRLVKLMRFILRTLAFSGVSWDCAPEGAPAMESSVTADLSLASSFSSSPCASSNRVLRKKASPALQYATTYVHFALVYPSSRVWQAFSTVGFTVPPTPRSVRLA